MAKTAVERNRTYRAKDPERWRAYYREWRAQADPRYRFGMEANKRGTERLDWKNLTYGPCVYCGLDDETVSWDHVVPLAHGGANQTTNCVRCCLRCNRIKRTASVAEFQDPVARKAAAAERRRLRNLERWRLNADRYNATRRPKRRKAA